MSLRMVEAVVACGFSILLFASLIVPFLLSCQSSGYEVYILEATYKDPAVSLRYLTLLVWFITILNYPSFTACYCHSMFGSIMSSARIFSSYSCQSNFLLKLV